MCKNLWGSLMRPNWPKWACQAQKTWHFSCFQYCVCGHYCTRSFLFESKSNNRKRKKEEEEDKEEEKQNVVKRLWEVRKTRKSSRKHAYIIVTPLNPTFIDWKWGLQGYTLFFLFLLKNKDCGYSLEPPRRGGSNEYPQSMFWAEIWKIS